MAEEKATLPRYYQKEKLSDREGVIAGRNAVLEALCASGSGLEKIFVSKGDVEGSIVKIIALAKQKKVNVQYTDKVKLEFLCGVKNHQGVVAYLAAKEYCSIDDILSFAKEKDEPPLIVIADEITDPHNLGAIIRTADACGAHGIIIPKHRGVGVTPAVSKASAGAVLHMPMAKVTNISAAIDELKSKGVWIYGADMEMSTMLFKTDFSGPCAIVVGSEGFGISRLVKEKCDFLVGIPMRGNVNSLNASVAAAVILYEVMRQRES